jgi:hypothetical protein
MQLIKKEQSISLTDKLTLAATALITGSTLTTPVIAQENDAQWEFSASTLAYSETDRVSAAEFILDGNKDFSDTSNLSFKVVLDSLTGASANGAIAQNTVQTFTRPSGKGQFDIGANNTPLDDTFKDTRAQFNISWTDQLAEDMRYTVGSNLSKEYDYASLSINGAIARDFNQKNSTFSAGLSLGSDQYSPEGNIPVAFSSMVIDSGQFANSDDYWAAFDATRSDSSETITTSEVLFGWTQVVNRKMLMQFNYGYSDVSGYLTDPFKVLSVVNNSGITQDLVYENRPDSKTQHSIFALTKYHLDNSVFDVSYRYLTNDWDITSHTIDTHWHFMSNNGSFWEPHIRFYQQSAAEFYSPFLLEGVSLPATANQYPAYASADYRIGEMTAVTLGLKYGFQMDDGARAEIRLEYYKQTPTKANQPTGVTGLDGLELYPEIDALILQFNYYF